MDLTALFNSGGLQPMVGSTYPSGAFNYQSGPYIDPATVNYANDGGQAYQANLSGQQVLGDSTSVRSGSAPAQAPVDPYAAYGGAANYNNTVNSYDQAIANAQGAIGRLPGQQNSANSAINSSSQDALSQLLGGFNQAKSSYDTNKLQTGQNFVTSKNSVGANAGNSLNSLLRLLGSRGAGGGSPVAGARGAVAQEATLQRGDLGRTFGQNNQALDTGWGNYNTGYNNQVSSVNKQRDNSLAQNADRFNTQQASLLQSIAQLSGQKAGYTGGNATAASQPYLDQANGLLNGLGNFNYTPVNYQTQAYQSPDLAKYTTNPYSTPTVQGQPQTSDYTSPYLAALLGKKQPA